MGTRGHAPWRPLHTLAFSCLSSLSAADPSLALFLCLASKRWDPTALRWEESTPLLPSVYGLSQSCGCKGHLPAGALQSRTSGRDRSSERHLWASKSPRG